MGEKKSVKTRIILKISNEILYFLKEIGSPPTEPRKKRFDEKIFYIHTKQRKFKTVLF